MSSYDASTFIIHLVQALEDVLEEHLGVDGLVALAVQVARRMRKLSEELFKHESKIDVPDVEEFVKDTSVKLCGKLGMHMSIETRRENGDIIVKVTIAEKSGTPAILIPLTIVGLVLEEMRQRADKKYVISDAHIAEGALEFRLVPA